eukprot:SAG22_NODE_69_length_22779_cov_71.088139_17_plen_84_part_00
MHKIRIRYQNQIRYELKNVKEIMSIYDEFVIGLSKEQFMNAQVSPLTLGVHTTSVSIAISTIFETVQPLVRQKASIPLYCIQP